MNIQFEFYLRNPEFDRAWFPPLNVRMSLLAVLLMMYFCPSWAVQVEDILLPLKVSKSNISTWATPIAYRDEKLFIVTVERSNNLPTGINLKTVVRKGELTTSGWNWQSFVVDSETIDDQWHNVASLALDAKGYIHIAYNMHNMPWQYVVSKHPLEINEFEFKGDRVRTTEKQALKYLNRTPFPSIGNALIPGNQVTYPAFFTDKIGDLYITYRFAARPNQAFRNRGFGAGIAKYDVISRTWVSLGDDFLITNNDATKESPRNRVIKPFALSFGWWAYFPRLGFDSKNKMHLVWMWRQGGAGADLSHPSYAWSGDGGMVFKKTNGRDYKLPISVKTTDPIDVFSLKTKFLGPTRLLIGPGDIPYLLFQPKGQTRMMVRLDKKTMKWLKPEKMPSSALDFAFDTKGNLWAFATGLKIFKRSGIAGSWQLVHEDREAKKKDKSKVWCQPKVLTVPERDMFLVHSQTCDYERVKVTKVKWN